MSTNASSNTVLAALMAAPEYVNPAIALSLELMAAETRGDVAIVEKAIRSGAVEKALIDGQHEATAVMKALQACGHAIPQSSRTVPVGF